jgi:hypothetical protein
VLATTKGRRSVWEAPVPATQSLVSDPDEDLSKNTTDQLGGDIERPRAHLGIERWVVAFCPQFGSWHQKSRATGTPRASVWERVAEPGTRSPNQQ